MATSPAGPPQKAILTCFPGAAERILIKIQSAHGRAAVHLATDRRSCRSPATTADERARTEALGYFSALLRQ